MANCDYDYINTMGFNLIKGRNFSPNFPADSLNLIVTESVVKKAGFDNPIGQQVQWEGRQGQIIGVIEDFHNLGIRETLQPTVLNLGKGEELGAWASIFVRYEPGKETETLDLIRESYKSHNPDYPLQWNFLDTDFEHQFRSEITVGLLSKYFTVMAIIISCLGLFGLALFDIERRRKEISIRKVLGASTSRLTVLLCSDFVRLVIIAILIGSPIAYYLSDLFLGEYAYHAPLNILLFIVAALTMFVLSISIISFQSIKAARSNPVDAIRNE
jgi:ABC-type antimicrobial peptide transport system permease subunit